MGTVGTTTLAPAGWLPGQTRRGRNIVTKRRAPGITSYYNSVKHIDVTSEEIREMEKAERRMDLIGQTFLVLVVILAITLVGAHLLRADDPYDPVPGAYDGLTTEEIEQLEAEREASRMIDQEVSRGAERVMMMEATAYTWTGQRTASGTWPAVGTVATDPEVIPLGTNLYIEGYGEAVAEDTGGAVKGNIIDVYLDTESECWQWGRRMVEVRILE
jgi:3D (Asp-Asp-Asp) domain-containing protein